MSDNAGDLTPRLGDGDSVRFALASVERVLRRARCDERDAPEVRTAAAGTAAVFTDLEQALLRLVGAHANVSAVLLQVIEGTSAITADFMLEVLKRDAQAHADLDSLDEGIPFDA